MTNGHSQLFVSYNRSSFQLKTIVFMEISIKKNVIPSPIKNLNIFFRDVLQNAADVDDISQVRPAHQNPSAGGGFAASKVGRRSEAAQKNSAIRKSRPRAAQRRTAKSS
jgi:hypothetical protein